MTNRAGLAAHGTAAVLACAEFRALLAADPLAASTHIELCETCLHRAGSEVVPSVGGTEQADASASPPA